MFLELCTTASTISVQRLCQVPKAKTNTVVTTVGLFLRPFSTAAPSSTAAATSTAWKYANLQSILYYQVCIVHVKSQKQKQITYHGAHFPLLHGSCASFLHCCPLFGLGWNFICLKIYKSTINTLHSTKCAMIVSSPKTQIFCQFAKIKTKKTP